MNFNNKKILIIGSTGFLGSALLNLINSSEFSASFINRSLFDLSKSISIEFKDFMMNEKFQYVVICAAITDVEKCYQEPIFSQLVNIEGTISLLDLVKKSGAVPIFFSSDYVFSGKSSSYEEDYPRMPKTLYGHQKLTVEKYLETHFDKFLIFRTSKLMSKTTHFKNILYPLIRDLAINKPSRCFEDQWLNPVFVEDIASVLQAALKHDLVGTFHLGTRTMYTRAELGRFLASSLGYNIELIQSIHMSDIKFSEERPTNNMLNCQKIERTLGFRFCEVEDALLDLKKINALI